MFMICSIGGSSWILHFTCHGGPQGEESAQFECERGDLTLGNLTTIKSQLGFGLRDFMYYKQRSGSAVATLKEIGYDVDANEMVECNEDEREVRLVLSKEQVTDPTVAITPIKSGSNTLVDEDLEDPDLDAYKDWLFYLHERQQGMGEFWCCHPSI